MEALHVHDDTVWCRAQCGRSVHRACFNSWRRETVSRVVDRRMDVDRNHDDDEEDEDNDIQRLGGPAGRALSEAMGEVRCVFCRAKWRWDWQD